MVFRRSWLSDLKRRMKRRSGPHLGTSTYRSKIIYGKKTITAIYGLWSVSGEQKRAGHFNIGVHFLAQVEVTV